MGVTNTRCCIKGNEQISLKELLDNGAIIRKKRQKW